MLKELEKEQADTRIEIKMETFDELVQNHNVIVGWIEDTLDDFLKKVRSFLHYEFEFSFEFLKSLNF